MNLRWFVARGEKPFPLRRLPGIGILMSDATIRLARQPLPLEVRRKHFWQHDRWQEAGQIGGPQPGSIGAPQSIGVQVPVVSGTTDALTISAADWVGSVSGMNYSNLWVFINQGTSRGPGTARYEYAIPPYTPGFTLPINAQYMSYLVQSAPDGTITTSPPAANMFIQLVLNSTSAPLSISPVSGVPLIGVSKDIAAVALPGAIWTPAAGKKFSITTLMLFSETANTGSTQPLWDCIATNASAGAVRFADVSSQAGAAGGVGNAPFENHWNPAYTSIAVNNVLYNQGAAITVGGYCSGTEQ